MHITFQNSVRTSLQTRCISITRISWFMVSREIMVAYSENHTYHTNTVTGKNSSAVHDRTGATYNYSYHWGQIHMQMFYDNTSPIHKAHA
jgi:hypothetical protein